MIVRFVAAACCLTLGLVGCGAEPAENLETASPVSTAAPNQDPLELSTDLAESDEPPLTSEVETSTATTVSSEVPDTVPEPEIPTPDVSATVIDFYTEYREERDAWKERFSNKVVELTGVVVGYKSQLPNVDTGLYVLLDGEEFDKVDVEVSEDRPWLAYPPGCTITAIGRVRSTAGLLKEAVITGSEPGPDVPSYSAAELFALDFEEVNRFEGHRHVYVRGAFTHFADDFDQTGILYLGNEQEDLVAIRATDYERFRVHHLEPGDEVVALGIRNRREGELPKVHGGYLIEPLPELPPFPEVEPREKPNGDEAPHVIFTSELLHDWMTQEPRILEPFMERETSSSLPYIEVTGEFDSLTTREGDNESEYVRLKMDPGVDVEFAFDQGDPVLDTLKPGQSLTIRGHIIYNILSSRMSVWSCQVVND